MLKTTERFLTSRFKETTAHLMLSSVIDTIIIAKKTIYFFLVFYITVELKLVEWYFDLYL